MTQPRQSLSYGSVLWTILLLSGCTAVFAFASWDRLELDSTTLVSLTFTAGLVGAGALVLTQAFHYQRAAASGSARLRGLLVAVYVAVLFFALAYYLLASSQPEQFTSLRTRLDAIYFTLSVLSTVGFGDVHADGQAARAMVCAQMGFNILVISLAVNAVRKANDGGGAGENQLPARRTQRNPR